MPPIDLIYWILPCYGREGEVVTGLLHATSGYADDSHRFDKLLYLGVSEDHESQYNILKALTRK